MEPRVRLRNKLWWLLVGLAACDAQPAVPMRTVLSHTAEVRTSQGITYLNGAAFTGRLISLQPNRKDTFRVQDFRYGRPHGVLKQFYPDGKPEVIRSFQEGKKEGKLEAWWANGHKRLEYTFSNGEYEGEGKEWNVNGRLMKRMHYVKGQETGLQQQWTDRGDIWANYVVRQGRRYGITGVKSCTSIWNDNEILAH